MTPTGAHPHRHVPPGGRGPKHPPQLCAAPQDPSVPTLQLCPVSDPQRYAHPIEGVSVRRASSGSGRGVWGKADDAMSPALWAVSRLVESEAEGVRNCWGSK